VEVDAQNGAELFYYFVQSESGAAAPFLLWLTGGDRCSVFSGLAFEIGRHTTPRPRTSSNFFLPNTSHRIFGYIEY